MPPPIRDAPSCDVSDLANKIVIETCNKVYKMIATPYPVCAMPSFTQQLVRPSTLTKSMARGTLCASHSIYIRPWHSDWMDVVVGGDGALEADEHDVVGVGGVDAGGALQAEDAAEEVARVAAAPVAPVLPGDHRVAQVALRDKVVGPPDGAVGGDGHAVVAEPAVAAHENLKEMK